MLIKTVILQKACKAEALQDKKSVRVESMKLQKESFLGIWTRCCMKNGERIGLLPFISPNGGLLTGRMILQPLKPLIDFGGLLDI